MIYFLQKEESMTKKCFINALITSLLIIFMIVGLAAPAYCDDPMKKLGRGLCNLITFPLELPTQMTRVNNDEGPMASLTWGIVKGLAMTVVRLGAGAYETFTFPFPVPKDYKPLLTDPEFFMEDKSW